MDGESGVIIQSPFPPARIDHIVLLMRVAKRGGRVVVEGMGMGVRVRSMESRIFLSLRMAGEVHDITQRLRTCIVTGLRVRNEVFCHRVDLVAHLIMM